MEQNLISKLISSKIGFEFEFFSNYSLTDTSTLISNYLGVRVDPFYKKDGVIIKPTENRFLLIRDVSGGKDQLELITGPILYRNAILILKKVLLWISANGYTSDYSAFHFNISYDNIKIENINLLKFILDFDEDFIYSRFPNRIDNVYAKSIKNLYPINKVINNYNNIDSSNYQFPIGKWYGFNFKKLQDGYVECRYLGGSDYEDKDAIIIEIVNYVISKLYDCIVNKQLSEESTKELERIIDEHAAILKSYHSYDEFKKNFPDIKLTVDLQDNIQIIKTHYHRIRDLLFDVLNLGDLKKGNINYDSDCSRLQLKKCELTNSSYLNNLDIIECKLTGIIENCNLHNCDIINAHVRECDINNCIIENGRIRNCISDKYSNIKNAYLFGKDSIHSANITGGFFVSGSVTSFAKIENCEIFEIKKIK